MHKCTYIFYLLINVNDRLKVHYKGKIVLTYIVKMQKTITNKKK